MCTIGHVSGQAYPFDVGTAGTADAELDTKLVSAAQGAAVLNAAFDMPVAVLQQPGTDVTEKEIEPGGRQRTTDIAGPARLGGKFAHFVGSHDRRADGAGDDKKRSGNNTLHRWNLAWQQLGGQ